jgi:hypothetical protein
LKPNLIAMLLPIPGYISAIFISTVLVALIWVILSMVKSDSELTRKAAHIFGLLLLMWCVFQSTLALNKWYIDRISTPPHLTFALAGPIVLFTAAMLFPYTRRILDGLSLFHLTAIHMLRIPVELTLWLLYIQQQVPESMTFEGHNFDIIMGITAIPISILVWKNRIGKTGLILWNCLGILLLGIIVTTAIGSAPTSVQWRDFTHPNYAVIHFPFIWLPSFVVPVVLFGHVLSLRQLLRKA